MKYEDAVDGGKAGSRGRTEPLVLCFFDFPLFDFVFVLQHSEDEGVALYGPLWSTPLLHCDWAAGGKGDSDESAALN